ncbi:LIC_13029 family protein [Leptospira sp. GIMC2001]|uniref:LIC_13029 family protein n=1 Tax=Leptospira sp. GIMC2001 TaxID=1513297 RepID=UPI00234BE233|nr:hypothetical protein [Leptospira sp. GIMC2001]WCL49429.1 hypothetical protein O4O04_19395 [Leptospira sp. GIMC2001]
MAKLNYNNTLNSKAGLLWKSIERQSEVQTGLVRLNKEVTLRILINKPQEFLEANRFDFTKNMKLFMKTVVTMDSEKLEYFIFRLYDCYLRELQYIENRNNQFSIDILFQVIETLTIEKDSLQSVQGYFEAANSDSLTRSDMENILHHMKAFNLMAAQFQRLGNLKKAIELTDQIILKIATLNPMVTVMALDNMFSLILAQNILATKYALRNLLSGWMEEYGFSKDQAARILPLFPNDSSLNEFRSVYTKAMQSLMNMEDATANKEMDLFMLRTICNYFTSWLNRVANQLPAVA